MKKIYVILICILTISCHNPAVTTFTNIEQKYIDSVSNQLDCEIRVQKDYSVLEHDLDSGHLYLFFDFENSRENYCLKDSSTLQNFVIPIASGFYKVMDKRYQYDSLSVEFTTIDKSVPQTSTPTCEKTFSFSVDDFSKFNYKGFLWPKVTTKM